MRHLQGRRSRPRGLIHLAYSAAPLHLSPQRNYRGDFGVSDRPSALGKKAFWVFFACLLLLTAPTQAQTAAPVKLPETSEAFGIALRDFVEKNGFTSAVVVVRRRGQVVYTSAVGGADANKPRHLASLSKAITAACVASLIRDGKLVLSTPLRTAAPKLLAAAGPLADPRVLDITVAQLITHRSGLAGNRGDGEFSTGARLRDILQREGAGARSNRVIAAGVVSAGMKRDPGEFIYGNDNYAVLAAIIEDMDGRDYATACQDRVLKPAGVTGRLAPGWEFMSAYGGWSLSGADYLAVLSAMTRDAAIVGAMALEWHKEGADTGATASGRWYGLGLNSRKWGGDNNHWHSGSWRSAYTPKGGSAPVSASFRTFAVHVGAQDTGWFVALEPYKEDAVTDSIDGVMFRAFRAVKRW
jgi:CubicO group peptidase (beta-lactamase class C family)